MADEWPDRERLSQINERDPSRRRRNAFIPKKFWGMTWADYKPGNHTAEKEQLKDVLVDYADHWGEHEPGEGLVLLGSPGYGKTFGASLVAMQIIDQRIKSDDGWVRYITEQQWDERRKKLIGIEQQAARDGDWGAANVARYRLNFTETGCGLLVLDDVGKAYRSASGYTNSGVDALLRRRVELGKATIITSNIPSEKFTTIDPSLASFLYEVGEVVKLSVSGKDWRMRKPTSQVRRQGGASSSEGT